MKKVSVHTETTVIHGDHIWAEQENSVAPAIHYTATFEAKNATQFAEMASEPRHPHYYTRYGNPGHERVADILAQLEGTETALVTASGMGAISTCLLALLKAGDHVIGQTKHYMSTAKILDEVLPKFAVETTVVEQTAVEAFEQAIRPNTKIIMIETPVNPTLTVTDIEAVVQLAKKNNILVIADNTFASPINQRPHDFGVDIVVHSATKYLGGHHDITAGVICTSNELAKKIWDMHTSLGAVLSPMDAWLLLRGLRTLPIRMERINANALELAKFLEAHPKVLEVYYPGLESHPDHALAKKQMTGFGAVIAFAVDGDYVATQRFVSSLELTLNAVSLGGVESLVVHTASMWEGALTPAQMEVAGIPANFVRFSVGLEHIDDLKRDIEQALQQL